MIGGAARATGKWSDLTVQAQFLIDLEFLTRYTQPGGDAEGETSCVYTQSPPYLREIACQFPWVHFYAFRHSQPIPVADEYDPARPSLLTLLDSDFTQQTEFNRTTSPYEFSKEAAVTLSQSRGAPNQRLVMICHGENSMRQLALHALLRADHSLLDVCGLIPEDYLEGELVLPIFIPRDKIFVSLVASQSCKCANYYPETYGEEIGAPSPPHLYILAIHALYLCRLLPDYDARNRGIRYGEQGFNHLRIRQSVLPLLSVRPAGHKAVYSRHR